MFKFTSLFKLSLLWIMLVCFATSLCAIPKEETMEQILPKLEKAINTTMKVQGIPGAAIAIVTRDKVYYLKTFGVKRLGKQDKITPTTLFQIASLSKPINATLLAVLQEKGKLSLEDPIHQFIPGFNQAKNRKPIQICHLISHSSGVATGGYDGLIEKFTPRERILNKLKNARSVTAPGQQFAYHNAMYGMVEDVVCSICGKPFSQVLQEELFTPLGMRSASLGLQPLLNAKDRALPHVKYRNRYIPVDKYSSSYYAFPAAGGINASIQDMVPFMQLYLGKPSPIISKQSLKQLTDPFVKNTRAVMQTERKKGMISNTYYGLGWHSMNYRNRKVIYHQGHLKGFRSFMGFMQDDVGIIILTNADKRHASKMAMNFFDLYLNG